MTAAAANTQQEIEALQRDLAALTEQVGKVIVGQDNVISGVITCLLAGGHGLLEGVPGLGKTLLIRTVAEAVDLDFARVQFTPDLMPADIVGTSVLRQNDAGAQAGMLEFQPGPLPEAQLDRFLYKIQVGFPSEDDLMHILDRTTGTHSATVEPVVDAKRLMEMRALVRAIPVTQSLTRYVVRVLRATHPDDARAPDLVKRYVRFGGSPRGAQSVLLAARIRACLHGRAPSTDDVKAVALPALRHRVILNFEGEAEGIAIDDCLEQVLHAVPKD